MRISWGYDGYLMGDILEIALLGVVGVILIWVNMG
jgi:hypothetical protein